MTQIEVYITTQTFIWYCT